MSEYLHLQNQNTVRHDEYKNVSAIASIIFKHVPEYNCLCDIYTIKQLCR